MNPPFSMKMTQRGLLCLQGLAARIRKKIEVPKYVKLKYILSEAAFAEILFGISNTCRIWNVPKRGLLIPAKEGHRGRAGCWKGGVREPLE